MASKIIYLSRHGESIFNLEERIGGDSKLSKNGLKYSKRLSNYFNNKFNKLIVWTSKLKRTIQTGKNLNFPKYEFNELNEINAGIYENMTFEEFKINYPNEYNKRINNKLNYKYKNGESYVDLINRTDSIIKKITNTNDDILIISHQAILRVLIGRLLNKKLEDIPFISIPLHTLFKIEISNDNITFEKISLQ